MTKYIDADLLIRKIRGQIRLENLNLAALGGGGQTFCVNTLEWVLKQLDTLQQEQLEKPVPADLEEATEKHSTNYDSTIYYILESSNQKTIWRREHNEIFIAGAKWQKEQTKGKKWIFEDEYHKDMERSFQDGRENMKEQMMKEAVEGIAVINANAKEDGFGYVRSDYMPDDVLRGLGNFKLIIVKEDKK